MRLRFGPPAFAHERDIQTCSGSDDDRVSDQGLYLRVPAGDEMLLRGSFGRILDPAPLDYLTPVPEQMRKDLRRILPPEVRAQIGVDNDEWVQYFADLLDKVEKDVENDFKTVRELIEEAKNAEQFGIAVHLQKTLRTIGERQLLGFLANKSIRPKYGFPVDTVELMTQHCQEPVGRNLELSRDLSQAIYDYAPGNQIVAGGKVWTSRGIHRVPKRELEQFEYRGCRNCDKFEAAHTFDAGEVCGGCKEPFTSLKRFVIPAYGFVADAKAADVGTRPQNANGAVPVTSSTSATLSTRSPGDPQAVSQSKPRQESDPPL